MFSHRLPDQTPNRLSVALAEARASGRRLLDLTESNPTRVGLSYPAAVLEALADRRAEIYEPHPLGLEAARVAVAAELSCRSHPVSPARVMLTASTSEAYSLLFKLLCDPGDEVLVPQPSYPLFEHLTRLDGVSAVGYPVEYDGGWHVDMDRLSAAVSGRTRAILLVNPNNPTGSYVAPGDLERIATLAGERSLALIGDEVFFDYPLEPGPGRLASVLDVDQSLAFSLGGLSKSAGLPQMKLAWIIASGPERIVERALGGLEIIGDTYLSVSTPVQAAAPALLAAGRGVRAQIRDRLRGNLATLRRQVDRAPSISVPAVGGGWSAVLRVPAIVSEETLVLTLLEQDDVLVHPGYFFDFSREAFVVVSLLPAPDVFAEGIERVVDRIRRVDG